MLTCLPSVGPVSVWAWQVRGNETKRKESDKRVKESEGEREVLTENGGTVLAKSSSTLASPSSVQARSFDPHWGEGRVTYDVCFDKSVYYYSDHHMQPDLLKVRYYVKQVKMFEKAWKWLNDQLFANILQTSCVRFAQRKVEAGRQKRIFCSRFRDLWTTTPRPPSNPRASGGGSSSSRGAPK